MALDAEGGRRRWEKNWTLWVERAHQRHNNYFTYQDMNRIGSPQDGWRVKIVCPEHGEFLQDPKKHMFGQACPKCSGLGLDKVTQLKAKYPNWNWEGVVVTHSKKPITLTCPEHGEFQTLFNRLMNKEDHVPPCPQCARDQGGLMRRKNTEHWHARIKEKHGDRYTVVVEAERWDSDITLLCKEHGEFTVKLGDVVEKGSGCPTCGAEARKKWQMNRKENMALKALENP